MFRRCRLLIALLSLVACNTAFASSSQPLNPGASLRPWADAQAMFAEAEAQRVQPFEIYGSKLWLLADGRLLWTTGPDSDSARSVAFGNYTRTGDWIEFALEGGAVDLERLSAQERAQFEEQKAAMEAASASAGEPSPDDQAGAESFRQKMLVVPYQSGELLIHEAMLMSIAGAWDGKGPLELGPMGWRLPQSKAVAGPEAKGTREFKIADPMQANLPTALRSLLRPKTIETRIGKVVDASKASATDSLEVNVLLELEDGTDAGLYKGMVLRGLPPDEDLHVTVGETSTDSAQATISLQRFAPADPVKLPLAGARLASRRDYPQSCGVDTTAAVTASVTSVAAAVDRREVDETDTSWVELRIDRGSAHGLVIEDELQVKGDWQMGEGRVRALEPHAATVLWRKMHYGDDKPLLPKVGARLWTSAARRDAPEEQVTEVIVD